jgi:hypothetical protein
MAHVSVMSEGAIAVSGVKRDDVSDLRQHPTSRFQKKPLALVYETRREATLIVEKD